MVREVDAIGKRPQGNKDADSNWANARHRFVVQMLMRFGAEPDFTISCCGFIPECFNREKLTPMYENDIAWWDEVHKECLLGDLRASRRLREVQSKRKVPREDRAVNGQVQ